MEKNKSKVEPSRIIDFLNKVESSDKYKALTPEQQKQVKGKLYDKIVAPWYQRAGTSVMKMPSKEEWLSGKPIKQSFAEQDISGKVAVVKGASQLVKGVISAGETFSKIMGLGEGEKEKKAYETLRKPFDYLEKRADEYLGDHYSSSLSHRAKVVLAEQFGQLPAYMVAGEVKLPATAAKLYPIATKLINNASLGYLSSLILGHNQREAAETGAAFAAFYPIEKAGGFLTKSLLGRITAIGGIPAVRGLIERGEVFLAKRGGPEKLMAEFKQATVEGRTIKISDPIGQAGAQLLNTIARRQFKTDYNFLPAKYKQWVVKNIVEQTKEVVENNAAFNKDVVTNTVKQVVATQSKSNPTLAKNIEAFKKVGADIVRDNADVIVGNANVRVGRSSISKSLERIQRGSSNEADKVTSWVDALNRLNPTGPGAASIHDPAFKGNLLALVKNNYKLENPDHQLIQLWGIRGEFPKTIQNTIRHYMEMKYPPSKGFTVKDYNKMVVNLEKHISDVATAVREETPGGVKHGAKVFRSTIVAPGKSKTGWQKELNDEAEVARIKKQAGNKEAKAAVKSVSQVLRRHSIKPKGE